MHRCKQSSANDILHFLKIPKITAYLSSFLFFRGQKDREYTATAFFCFTNKYVPLKMTLKKLSLPHPIDLHNSQWESPVRKEMWEKLSP